ncbi:MAG TPA: glycosyltransferase family 8 protein [Solirubrobacteraceae bacterium]|jgi:lipopolysaccharide biosynthesis glycosyltransferase|nr:glycosyltransferase family 8 protein [Solirubrobacteraceae bacterium]
MSAMHVACAADERYVPHCATAVRSLTASNPGVAITVHLLHGPELSAKSVARLGGMSGGELTIVAHAVDPGAVAGLPPWGRIPETMWYRILLPDLLPDVDRVLYLDADVLVLDALTDLWGLPLDAHYLAAVTNVPERHRLGHAAELGLAGPERYFNSGVLLLNLKLMRRDGCTAALRERARRDLDRLLWPDQDVLNLVLGERRIALDPRWNLMNSIRRFPWAADLLGRAQIAEAIARPAIIHFEGPAENKPWHVLCDHPARPIYEAHRGHTPWARYRREGLTPGTAARLLRRRLLASPAADARASASTVRP